MKGIRLCFGKDLKLCANRTPEPTPEPTATPIPIEELKSLCKEIDYKSILRDPAAHFGEYVKITVQISQVVDASWSNGYKTGYRCYSDNSGYGVYFDDEYYIEDARPDGSVKLLSDDVITVYGVVYGTIEVERAINGTKDEIAYISMLDCELQGE